MAKGCNISNYVITNPSGQFVLPYEPYREIYNGQTLIVRYNGMQLEEGKCYISNPYGFNFQVCRANGSNGSVINYTESQVTCIPPKVDVPLDDSISFLVVLGCFVIWVVWGMIAGKRVLEERSLNK